MIPLTQQIKNIIQIYLPPLLKEPLYNFFDKYNKTPKIPAEILIVKHLCVRLKKSIDIGSHRGVFINPMLRRSSHVIAFEPHPELAKTIQSKFLYQRVLVYQYALSNQECQVNLRIPVLEGSELIALSSIENKNTLNKLPTKTIEVDCKRLDDFVFNDVGFIKIDIEGHELAVLQGAENTITKSHPNFLIEVEERHREGAIESVQKFFSDKGYQGFFIFGRQLLPLEDFQLSLHQNPENINIDRIVAGSQYANNFVFTKSESLIKRLPKHL